MRSPPNQAIGSIVMMLSFHGDCNTPAVKAQVISNFAMYSGFSKGVDFDCNLGKIIFIFHFYLVSGYK